MFYPLKVIDIQMIQTTWPFQIYKKIFLVVNKTFKALKNQQGIKLPFMEYNFYIKMSTLFSRNRILFYVILFEFVQIV